jgi:hypothetical protein
MHPRLLEGLNSQGQILAAVGADTIELNFMLAVLLDLADIDTLQSSASLAMA